MKFGQALEFLKAGERIARHGWNGKNMFLYLNKGVFDGPLLGFKNGDGPGEHHPSTIDGISLSLFENGGSDVNVKLPSIAMRTATGAILTGWLASQTDMLAEDWVVFTSDVVA